MKTARERAESVIANWAEDGKNLLQLVGYVESAIVLAVTDEREACATRGDAYQQEAIRNAQAMGSSIAARAARQAWEERSIGAAHVAQDIRSRGTR